MHKTCEWTCYNHQGWEHNLISPKEWDRQRQLKIGGCTNVGKPTRPHSNFAVWGVLSNHAWIFCKDRHLLCGQHDVVFSLLRPYI